MCTYPNLPPLLLVGIAYLISACGSQSKRNNTDATLEGAWSYECLEITSAGKTELQTKRFDFEESAFTEALIVFAATDTDCKTQQQSQSIVGTYTKDETQSPEQINFTITTASATINDETTVSYLNADAGSGNANPICGGGWVKGKSKALKKADCKDHSLSFPYAGLTLYDIYEISGSTLSFGLRNHGTPDTPAERPTTLNTTLALERTN